MNRFIIFLILWITCFNVSFAYAENGESEETATPGFAHMNVYSQPEGANIYVNGSWHGKAPLYGLMFAPGKYRVTTELEGYTSGSMNIQLTADDEIDFEIRLYPGPASRSEWWSPVAFFGTMGVTVGVIVLSLAIL
ncbi:MAG: PEGA domain-containing protein [bacterium]|nr:PEGA domain-containing protein [bacterium]